MNRSLQPCVFTPRDYFLVGYVKLLVNVDKTQTLDDLEVITRHVIIAATRSQLLNNVIKNWTSRLPYKLSVVPTISKLFLNNTDRHNSIVSINPKQWLLTVSAHP